MILEEETFKRFSYYPRDLSKGSHKKVLVKCDKCGKIRFKQFRQLSDLCISCAQKGRSATIETRKKMSKLRKREKNSNYRGGKEISCDNCSKLVYKKPYDLNKYRSFDKYFCSNKCFIEWKLKNKVFANEGNPNWHGGKSFEPYCVLFNKEFKERVREFWNRKCILCSKTELENGRKLIVHHVDYNKDTCCDESIPLFVALCMSCHGKTNSNREYWKNEFKRIIYSRNIDGKCYYSKEEYEEIKKNKKKLRR